MLDIPGLDNSFGFGTMTFSPDGKYMTVGRKINDQPALWLYRVSDGQLTNIFNGIPQSKPVWSADSTKVVFNTRGGQYHRAKMYNVSSGASIDLYDHVDQSQVNPVFSADGKWMLVRAKPGSGYDVETRLYNLDTMNYTVIYTVNQLSGSGTDVTLSGGFSPDSSEFTYNRCVGNVGCSYYRRSVTGTGVGVEIPNTSAALHYRVFDYIDNNTILFQTNTGLFKQDLTSGVQTQMAQVQSANLGQLDSVVLSPDRTKIALGYGDWPNTAANDGAYTINVSENNMNMTLIAKGPKNHYVQAWSPDSKIVMLSSNDTAYYAPNYGNPLMLARANGADVNSKFNRLMMSNTSAVTGWWPNS